MLRTPGVWGGKKSVVHFSVSGVVDTHAAIVAKRVVSDRFPAFAAPRGGAFFMGRVFARYGR